MGKTLELDDEEVDPLERRRGGIQRDLGADSERGIQARARNDACRNPGEVGGGAGDREGPTVQSSSDEATRFDVT